MRVYIAEKPSQGREIAKALGGRPSGSQPIPVPGGQVAWALGHLLELVEPHAYDDKWKHWDEGDLPILPEGSWRKKASKGRQTHLKQLREIIDSPKVKEIVICTDAGREGELIAREVIETTKAGKRGIPIRRMWTSALNPAALKKALDSLRPGSDTEGLYRAAQLRERADWMEGLSLTRMFTIRCRSPQGGSVISAGRVQTPALALVVRRDLEILNFEPKDYFELAGDAVPQGGSALPMHHAPKSEDRMLNPKEAERRRALAEGAKGPIRTQSTSKKRTPPMPYDLAALQSVAASRKGWAAKKTLEVAQRLYETHKAISYPRTDGTAFDPTEWDGCMAALDRMSVSLPSLAQHVPSRSSRVKRSTVFNAKRLEGKDHHALMPTSEAPAPTKMTPDEAWLFEIVSRRFLAQFLPDWEFDLHVAKMDANGVPFEARARTTTKEGWKAIDAVPKKSSRAADGGEQGDPDDAPEADPSSLADGTQAIMKDVKIETKSTKPPPSWTEGSLVKAMQRAGIGTQATWAATIEILKNRGYVVPKGKKLESTQGGRQLIAIAEARVPELVETESTARLEKVLDEVASGKRDAKEAEQMFRRRVSDAVDALRGEPLGAIHLEAPSYGPKRRKSAPRRSPARKKRTSSAGAPKKRRAAKK